MEKRQRIASYALVIVEDHILMVQMGKGPNHGRWALPGGGIEFGEHPIESLEREILEETGIKVTDFVLNNVISAVVDWIDHGAPTKSVHNVGIIYRARTSGLRAVKSDPDGFSSLGSKWILLKDLKADMISKVFLEYLKSQGLISA